MWAAPLAPATTPFPPATELCAASGGCFGCDLAASEGPKMERKKDHVVLTAREARGATLGRPVLAVLLVSLALVIVAFALAWWLGKWW